MPCRSGADRRGSRAQRAHEDVGPRVAAEVVEARLDRADRPAVGPQRVVLELLRAQRRGDGRAGPRPRRIGRHDGLRRARCAATSSRSGRRACPCGTRSSARPGPRGQRRRRTRATRRARPTASRVRFSGTTTCTPREPVPCANGSRPASRRAAPQAQRATAHGGEVVARRVEVDRRAGPGGRAGRRAGEHVRRDEPAGPARAASRGRWPGRGARPAACLGTSNGRGSTPARRAAGPSGRSRPPRRAAEALQRDRPVTDVGQHRPARRRRSSHTGRLGQAVVRPQQPLGVVSRTSRSLIGRAGPRRSRPSAPRRQLGDPDQVVAEALAGGVERRPLASVGRS